MQPTAQTANTARMKEEQLSQQRSKAAKKAWVTRQSAKYRANKSEQSSKQAVVQTSMRWLLAAFDGQTLHILPEMTGPKKVI